MAMAQSAICSIRAAKAGSPDSAAKAGSPDSMAFQGRKPCEYSDHVGFGPRFGLPIANRLEKHSGLWSNVKHLLIGGGKPSPEGGILTKSARRRQPRGEHKRYRCRNASKTSSLQRKRSDVKCSVGSTDTLGPARTNVLVCLYDARFISSGALCPWHRPIKGSGYSNFSARVSKIGQPPC